MAGTAAERAFDPVRVAIAAGRIPGAAFGVITQGGDRAVCWDGHAALQPAPEPLDRATWFDLASLTKVMVTTPEILRLVEQGAVALDDPLARHLPDLGADDPAAPVRTVTLRRLLTHHAGLPALETIHRWGGDSNALKAQVLRHDWPLGAPVYSDIGFILLGLAIERKRGVALRDLPVGGRAGGLTFSPDPATTAATEDCPWRGRIVRGEVHDENAFALGGAAGHAGLFGTIDGVLDFARDLMAGRLLGASALAEMRRRQTATRALGWQCRHTVSDMDEPSWVGGRLCSPDTIGHTGFTGTGLWLDFGRGIAWALLTNRVHPSRHAETGIQDLRRTVGDIVAAELPVA